MRIHLGSHMVEGKRWYRTFNHNRLIILLVSFGLLFYISGCGAYVTNTLPKLLQAQMQQSSTPTSATMQRAYLVGDTFMIGDLQYKINSIRTLDSDTNIVRLPKEGNTYLLVDLTIENHGSANAEIRSMTGFKLKDKDGHNQAFSIGAALAVKNAMDGTITAGGQMTGELGFEVIKGVQTFELVITPYPFSSKTAIVKIPTETINLTL